MGCDTCELILLDPRRLSRGLAFARAREVVFEATPSQRRASMMLCVPNTSAGMSSERLA
jgi:hypothetical protein